MQSNLLEQNIDDLLRTVLEGIDDDLLLVDPSAETVESLIDVATAAADPPTIDVVADERLLKEVMDDFLVAADAADLIDAGVLSLRVLENGADNTLLITEESLVALVTASDHVATLAADDDSFIHDAYETYRNTWETADDFNLRTPALSRVRETLDEQVGEPTREDFDSVLDSLETARGDGDGLDEVTISLLVAAKNDVLLYDISKWGEDVGIASKATFSRTKTRLEDTGLIDTEKVPIDVGRPRLRLKLGDDRLREADSDQLASVAYSMLN